MPAKDDAVVNLATSETGALLAWVRYLLREPLDAISPRIAARVNDEIRTRLVQPYHDHDDYWWMGFVPTPRVNNWNPWCNRNMLMCLLLLDLDADLRASCIRKAMRSLDAYLALYPPDGCCDEGPMYWGAAGGGLHTCLELLSPGILRRDRHLRRAHRAGHRPVPAPPCTSTTSGSSTSPTATPG